MGATRELLDRARGHMAARNLQRFVPNDPGGLGYAAAFDAIVADGSDALERPHDGQPLYRSFDFVETVNLTRWTPARNIEERWFRVLCCAAHLAARPLGEEAIPLNYSLVTLLVDSIELVAVGQRDAPLDLIDGVCAEMRASIEAGDGDPFAREADDAFCVLAQLLLPGTDGRRLCVELAAIDERAHHAPRAEFVWGLTVFDQLHPDWLALVQERMPASLEPTKQRLVNDGARWAKREPKLRSHSSSSDDSRSK